MKWFKDRLLGPYAAASEPFAACLNILIHPADMPVEDVGSPWKVAWQDQLSGAERPGVARRQLPPLVDESGQAFELGKPKRRLQVRAIRSK